MKQTLKVRTDEIDDDGRGRGEYTVHYTLYAGKDDDERPCFDLYCGDADGNGTMVARGYNEGDMRHMTLRLGEFVEWGSKGVVYA